MVLSALNNFNAFSEMSFEAVLNLGDSLSHTMQQIGIGFASIFILFVVFSSVSSILDGAQFQTKMLFPLVIYMLVLSFGIVSSTTKSVVQTVHKKCNEACQSVRKDNLGDSKTLLQYYLEQSAKMPGDFTQNFKDKIEKTSEELAEYGGFIMPDNDKSTNDYSVQLASDKPGDSTGAKEGDLNQLENEKAKRKGIAAIFIGLWESIKREMIEPFILWKDSGNATLATVLSGGFTWLIALICQWICSIVSFIMSNWGAINISILMAFGPLTWAFAVFPGNLRTAGAWFIRLIQFSLYSPIVNLIAAASFKIMGAFASNAGSGGGFGSCLAILCILCLNIFAMVNVPTIATMIIEGAQGSISLLASGAQISQLGEGMRDRAMTAAMRK